MRAALATALLGVIVAGCSPGSDGGGPDAAERPNIVFTFSDDDAAHAFRDPGSGDLSPTLPDAPPMGLLLQGSPD